MEVEHQRPLYDFPGKAKSEVWKNFGFYLGDDGYTLDKSRAICKYCRIGVRYTGNTTNLHTHYVNHHLRKDPSRFSQTATLTDFDETFSLSPPSVNDVVRLPASMTIPLDHHLKDVLKVSPLTSSLIEFIVENMLPLSILSSSTFQNLASTLDPKCDVPSSKYLEGVLQQMHEEEKNKVLITLKNLNSLTLTTDIWKTSQNYMTVRVNFVSKMWQLHSYVLQTCDLPMNPTPEYISETLQTLTDDWKIVCDPILVADPAACPEFANLKWKRLACFAETLNSAARKGFDVPEIQTLIGRARKVVQRIKYGRGLSALKDVSLLLDDERRWKTTFLMLSSIVKHASSIQIGLERSEFVKEDDLQSFFEDTNIKVCDDLVELLTPLHNASLLLCEQPMATASVILPALKKVEITLFGVKSSSEAVKEYRRVIWDEIKSAYSSDSARNFLLVCSLLDPRYKELRYVEAAEKEKARQLLYEAALKPFLDDVEIKAELPEDDDDIQDIILGHPFSIQDEAEPVAKKKKESAQKCENDWLFDVVGHKDDVISDKTAPMETVNSEVDRFMGEKHITSNNSLIWWYEREKIYPNLSCLARKYMCVMATCRPADQVFSQDGDTVSQRRTLLPRRNIDAMIFLNKNYPILKGADKI